MLTSATGTETSATRHRKFYYTVRSQTEALDHSMESLFRCKINHL